MPVTVSKPAFNLREALNSLRRKAGIKGVEVLTASTMSDAYTALKPVMFRNRFINGSFDVWQRGTSFGASPLYTADRWSSQSNPTGSTITREEFVPGQGAVPGNPKYFYRCTIGSTEANASDRVVLSQRVEDYHQFVGRWVVLSGWYRMTAQLAGANFLFQMRRSSSFYDIATEQADAAGALTPTTSWRYFERKVFVSPGALSGQTMTASASFGVMYYYQSVSQTGYIDFANLQLELDQATPFEYRPYAAELALCQRYFEIVDVRSSLVMNINASEAGRQLINYETKRATPTIGFGFSSISNYQFYGNASTSMSSAPLTAKTSLIYHNGFNAWTPSTGGCVYVNSTNNGSFDITVSAEL